jgi:hypothetical protein
MIWRWPRQARNYLRQAATLADDNPHYVYGYALEGKGDTQQVLTVLSRPTGVIPITLKSLPRWKSCNRIHRTVRRHRKGSGIDRQLNSGRSGLHVQAEICYEGLILDSGFQSIVKLFQPRQKRCLDKQLIPK